MPHIIAKVESVEQNWLKQLSNAISDPTKLLEALEIDPTPWQAGFAARELFALPGALSFVERMEKGNPSIHCKSEYSRNKRRVPKCIGYSSTADPLERTRQRDSHQVFCTNIKPRANDRKGGCAINCRYYNFRRHFPYPRQQRLKVSLARVSLDYVAQHPGDQRSDLVWRRPSDGKGQRAKIGLSMPSNRFRMWQPFHVSIAVLPVVIPAQWRMNCANCCSNSPIIMWW